MSGMFGGGHTQSAIPIRYNGVQIAQANAGACVPLAYGTCRLPFNLMWYGDFHSVPQPNTQGGKGGGSQHPTGYAYYASFVAGICEGPIQGINSVYLDKDLTSLKALKMGLFTGAGGQAPWAYLTTNFPSQAIPYDHVCYAVAQKYSLGSSASLPNITFEIIGIKNVTGMLIGFSQSLGQGNVSGTLVTNPLTNGTWNITFSTLEVRTCTVNGNNVTWESPLNVTASGTAYAGLNNDASPAQIVLDYLTDPNHGCSFPAASIAPLIGANSYESYCLALGIGLSLCETTQRAASDCLAEIFKITNSDAVWSAGTLKVIPYADTAVAGNGWAYTPNLGPLFIFTDDDYIEPPDLKRIATADTHNHVRIEYTERSNQYNMAIAEATDLGDIALTGERVMNTLSYHQITNSATARIVAQIALQTNLYERNTISFKVRADYGLLEPMDYIGIVDTALGYGTLNSVGQYTSGQVFRVTKVNDDDKDIIEIEAMEVPGTVRTSAVYSWANVQGYNANFAEVPGSVQAPAFLEAYETLVGSAGGRELWIAVGGPSSSVAWGGCNVYISFDNITYTQIAVQLGGARYGYNLNSLGAAADPDTVSDIGFIMNNTLSTMLGGTQADADQDRLLIAVDTGANTEIISFENAIYSNPGQYNLTYLRRGQYGTSSNNHAANAQVIRLDGQVIKLEVDPGYMGVPLYFKFPSFNVYGRATEDISTLPAYTYTMGQAVSAYNVISASTFLSTYQGVMFSPTTAFKMTSGAAAWDSSVYSTQSYLGGCTVECSPSYANKRFMMGLTTAVVTTTVNNYVGLQYAWYPDTSGNLYIYESGTQVAYGSGLVPYTTNDLLAITYDGKHIVYYHNGAIVRSVAVSGLGPLFAQFALCDPGAACYAMSYDNQPPVSEPLTLINFNTYSACVGNTTHKTGPNNAWDAAAYSTQAYSNGCALTAQQQSNLSTSNDMIGLTYNPTASVSYSNLAFGWDMVEGTAYIYESGAGPYLPGIAYNNATVFEITYDGKHVCYYAGGALARSVPLNNAVFYPQICLGNVNDVVGNISWGPLNSATTPFTLISLTTGTAASGTKIVSNYAQPQSQFGVRGWRSNESFSNGCTCSGVAPTGQAQYFGLSNNPVLSTGFAGATAAWYPHTDSSVTQVIFNGTNPINIANIAGTDVLTIEYDLFYFYWFRNNTLIYQQYAPNVGPLYLYGDFFYQGCTWANLSFAPNGALTPNPFIATGTCVIHDSACYKNNTGPSPGASAWDSGFYSINQYLVCHVQFKLGNLLNFMIGLTTTPPPTSGNSSYTSIGYALYSTNTGNYQIYEGGAYIGVFGGVPSITDLLAVTYNSATIQYFINGVNVRSVNVALGAVSAMGSFYQPGAQATAIAFGPGLTLDTVPTASIDANAVSTIGSASNATLQTQQMAYGATRSLALVSLAVTTTGNPVEIDAACVGFVSAGNGSYISPSQWYVTRDGVQLPGSIFDPSQSGTIAVSNTTFPGGIQVTLTVTDSVAAGTHTYALVMSGVLHFASSGSGNMQAQNCFIKVREIKK